MGESIFSGWRQPLKNPEKPPKLPGLRSLLRRTGQFQNPAVAAVPQPAPGDVDLAASRVYVFVGKTGLGHNHAVVGLLQAGRVVLGAAGQPHGTSGVGGVGGVGGQRGVLGR